MVPISGCISVSMFVGVRGMCLHASFVSSMLFLPHVAAYWSEAAVAVAAKAAEARGGTGMAHYDANGEVRGNQPGGRMSGRNQTRYLW